MADFDERFPQSTLYDAILSGLLPSPLQAGDLQKYAMAQRRVIPWGAMAAHPGDVEDRRGEALSPTDQARIIMGDVETPPDPAEVAGRIRAAGVTPLGIQAGMLNIEPFHQKWNRDRVLTEARLDRRKK